MAARSRMEKHAKADLNKRITLGIITGVIGFSLKLADASKTADRFLRQIAEIRKWFELLVITANVTTFSARWFYNRTRSENKSGNR
jgi:hypothetical protein